MAITATNLATATDATDLNSYSTASISPTANRLILVAVNHRTGSGSPNTPTISGNSLTYVQVRTINYNSGNRRLTLFRAMGSSPSSGAITIDFAGQTQTSCGWSVVEIDGVNTSGTNGSGAIVQHNGAQILSTTVTVTLSTFASANSATFAVCAGGDGALTATAGSGFSIVAQTNGGDISTASEFQSTNNTSVSVDWSASKDLGIIGVELAEFGSAPAYRSISSGSYSINGNTTTVDKPSDVFAGDILLFNLLVCTDTNTQSAIETITWPEGFTQIETLYNNSTSGNELQQSVAWKLATGSEPANYTASWTNNLGNKGLIVAISGATTVTPIDDSDITKSTSADTSVTSPSVTAEAINSLYVSLAINWDGRNYTPDTGFNERILASTVNWMADKLITAAGTTGTFTQTMSDVSSWVSSGVLVASQVSAKKATAYMTTNTNFWGS